MDLAWFAGVLDMKGTVIRKRNQQRRTPQLVLYVETKNYNVVRALSQLTGTRPELQAQRKVEEWMRRSCAEHCPEKHVHAGDRYPGGMPAIGRWTASGAAAAVVIYNTLPLMHTNRGLEEAMNEMLDQSTTSGQGWGATRKALRRLRDLGWRMPPQYRDLDLGTDADDAEAAA